MASRGFEEASTISATRRKQAASATLEPPNLCTTHLSILHTRLENPEAFFALPKAQTLMKCGGEPLDSREL